MSDMAGVSFDGRQGIGHADKLGARWMRRYPAAWLERAKATKDINLCRRKLLRLYSLVPGCNRDLRSALSRLLRHMEAFMTLGSRDGLSLSGIICGPGVIDAFRTEMRMQARSSFQGEHMPLGAMLIDACMDLGSTPVTVISMHDSRQAGSAAADRLDEAFTAKPFNAAMEQNRGIAVLSKLAACVILCLGLRICMLSAADSGSGKQAGQVRHNDKSRLSAAAIKRAESAVNRDPDAAEPRYAVAKLYRKDNRLAEAEKQFRLGWRLDDYWAKEALKKGDKAEAAKRYYHASDELKAWGDKAKSKDFFNKAVEIEMTYPSPKAILKQCKGMIFIDFDERGRWKAKYFAEVFQEGCRNKKPVLAFFYADNSNKGINFVMRESIIFKKLYNKYAGKIKMIAVNLPVIEKGNDVYNTMCRQADKLGAGPMGIFVDAKVRERVMLPRVRGPPSIALYSPYDVVQGETPEKNNGKIKLIDILFGGPTANKWVGPWLPWIEPWIETNIISPNKQYVVKLDNSADDKKVFYNKKR